jgi:hypothetical protein
VVLAGLLAWQEAPGSGELLVDIVNFEHRQL